MPRVFLTFDDGPNEPYTSAVLDTLQRYAAKATFFLCGANVEYYPDTARKILAAGHAIGNHSYSHAWRNIVSESLLNEVIRTDRILQQVLGLRTRLMRAPWGKMRPIVRRQLAHDRYQIFGWDIMAYDWWRPSAEYIARRVIERAHDGAIVLLHDGDRITHGSDRSPTVKALPIILDALQKQGYVFERLEEQAVPQRPASSPA
jgi:peptidoglycan/xylan/chitin deacetylase (PgdA/CDA1 family)